MCLFAFWQASNIEQEFKRIAEENKRLQSELSQTKEAKNKLEVRKWLSTLQSLLIWLCVYWCMY